MDPVLTEREGRVMTIRLNRPDRLNAVTPDVFTALSDAVAQARDPQIRAVILTGEGRGFCAGSDMKAARLPMEPGSRRMRHRYNPVMVELATLPKPVLAAVNGPAAGAGVSLAAAADLRLASDRARFAPGFVDVGLAPDTGGSYFLVRLLGYAGAFSFLTSGRKLSAEEALEAGLVQEVVEHDRLMDRARELAELLAGKPGVGVPATKELLQAALRNSLQDQLEAEAAMYDTTSTDPDRIAARAAMVERLSGNGPVRT